MKQRASTQKVFPRPGRMHPWGRVGTEGLLERAEWLSKRSLKKESKLRALRMAVGMCDLTTLEGGDTSGRIQSVCAKAVRPYVQREGLPDARTANVPAVAAVCVYTTFVAEAKRYLVNFGGEDVKVASVATAFPSGQLPIEHRLREVRFAVAQGADEVDMVINRTAFLEGNYRTVAREVERVRAEAGRATLKVILETGELGSFDAIRNASFIAMNAGADFIKTSTGKVQPASTLPVALCMLEAIRDFADSTGSFVGMKPAGGIRTAKDALRYLVMVRETLGGTWLSPELFRFGASALVNDLLAQILKQLTGAYRGEQEFSLD